MKYAIQYSCSSTSWFLPWLTLSLILYDPIMQSNPRPIQLLEVEIDALYERNSCLKGTLD